MKKYLLFFGLLLIIIVIDTNKHIHTHQLINYKTVSTEFTALLEKEPKKLLVYCDGLYILGPGSGTTSRFGLVGIGVTWLEWVCHCGCGYKVLSLVAWKSVFY